MLREAKPLILCLTNTVSMEFVANTLLAVGAAPVMSVDLRESEDLTHSAGSVYLNLGTLDAPFIEHCQNTVKIAARLRKPIILDPVGAGASFLRTKTARSLLPQASIVRGNASEIMALDCNGVKTLGVESTESVDAAKNAARMLSKQYTCAISISGKEDFITDGSNETSLNFGSSLMPRVTGMGCALTATIAAFHAIIPNAYKATILANTYFSLCGNLAQEKAGVPGSFKIAFLDALYAGDVESMEVYYEV